MVTEAESSLFWGPILYIRKSVRLSGWLSGWLSGCQAGCQASKVLNLESNLVASIRSSGQRLECAYWRIAHDDFTPLTTEISEVPPHPPGTSSASRFKATTWHLHVFILIIVR